MMAMTRIKTNHFIILPTVILFLIAMVTSCNYRTPSKKRFAKVCDIEIPENVEVVKDEYQDMWQDYAIVYEIKLNDKTCAELTESIRNSAYYNPNAFMTEYIDPSTYIDTLGMKAVWGRTKSGYYFGSELGRDTYFVEVDTIKMEARFDEGHD